MAQRVFDVEGGEMRASFRSRSGKNEPALFFEGRWGFAVLPVDQEQVDVAALTDEQLRLAYYLTLRLGKHSRQVRPSVAVTGRAKRSARAAIEANRAYFAELRKQQKFLRDYLASFLEGDTDYFVPLAGVLRVIHLDREHPVFMKAMAATASSVTVWGPPPLPDQDDRYILWTGPLAGWDPPAGPPRSLEYDLAIYLETPMGKVDGQTFCPRQVVKWTANTAGAAHFDPKKPLTFRNLMSTRRLPSHKANEAQRMIVELADWSVKASVQVLAFDEQPAPAGG